VGERRGGACVGGRRGGGACVGGREERWADGICWVFMYLYSDGILMDLKYAEVAIDFGLVNAVAKGNVRLILLQSFTELLDLTEFLMEIRLQWQAYTISYSLETNLSIPWTKI